MKFQVWLRFSNPTDPGSVAVRRLLHTLTGLSFVAFLPIQEKCVGEVELDSPPDWTDDQIMAVLRPLSPNAIGVRFEHVPAPEQGINVLATHMRVLMARQEEIALSSEQIVDAPVVFTSIAGESCNPLHALPDISVEDIHP